MEEERFLKLNKLELADSTGTPFREFRKSLTPHYYTAWLHVAMGWIGLIACNLLIIQLSSGYALGDLVLVGTGAVLIGFLIAYLQLFIHEGAHYNLHPRPQWNDLLCNVFVSGVVGQDVQKYRRIHWEHHRHLGTTMDTEISYFDPLSIKFVAEALLGIRALRVISRRKDRLRNAEKKQTDQSAPRSHTFAASLVFNTGYVLLLVFTDQWQAALAWLAGYFVFFPFFGALRNLLEHRSESADPDVDYVKVAHGAVHRLFGDGVIASTFGGGGFNRHLLHHWEPDISYTRLRELEDYLMKTECAAYLCARQTTYWNTFRRLFRPTWR